MLRKFCEQYPDADFLVALDSGYTSAEFCEIIRKDFKKDYVGSLRDDQTIFIKEEQTVLKDLVAAIRADHAGGGGKFKVQKTGYPYRGEKKYAYTYFANYKVSGFNKKQRLAICSPILNFE